jgi:hypothetical protein
MTPETQTAARERTRIYVTGSCEGLPKLREALENHDELELVGSAEQVRDAAGALTGGHLQVVLHATRGSSLPANELAAIREHTRAPIILLASGESSALLDEALDADVADVLLLPQLTENVVFAIRKASHAGRRSHGAPARHGRVVGIGSADAHEFHLAGLKFAPYEVMFRFARTHVLVPPGELTGQAVYEALRKGRAYFAIELAAEAKGFQFIAERGGTVLGTMGDEVVLEPDLRVIASLPAPISVSPTASVSPESPGANFENASTSATSRKNSVTSNTGGINSGRARAMSAKARSPVRVRRTRKARRSLSGVRSTSSSRTSWSTMPVTLPPVTIMRRESSFIFNPSGLRSSWDIRSKRGSVASGAADGRGRVFGPAGRYRLSRPCDRRDNRMVRRGSGRVPA